MEPDHYRLLSRIQDSHWFYRYRRKLLGEYIRKYAPNRRDLEILDYGAGTGANVPVLTTFGNVTCIEPEPLAVQLLRERWPGCKVIQDSMENEAGAPELAGSAGCFDIVIVSYVLYHKGVRDPSSTLKRLKALAKPGSLLISLEPAFSSLKRKLDRQVHGARRFDARSIQDVLRGAEWLPVETRYLLPSFFPAAWVLAQLDKLQPSDNKTKGAAGANVPVEQKAHSLLPVNKLAGFWLNSVDQLLFQLHAPFGVSVLTVSRA